jgi:hypothetical protein
VLVAVQRIPVIGCDRIETGKADYQFAAERALPPRTMVLY